MYQFDGERLVLDMFDCGPCDLLANMIIRMIFETAPFTLQ
jgi:hypothetical protein